MYSADSYNQPFWAKSANFIRGRDPLGIQNSSVSVYTRLLPGMTNVTMRLRYYGMYLWLLNEYEALPEGHPYKESAVNQYDFVRRAELLLAYMMVNRYPDEQSVVGSDYANRYKDDINKLGFYQLAEGADNAYRNAEGNDRGVYWALRSGALGQYFAGSLYGLGLTFTNPAGFFRVTQKGKSLGLAFRASISDECTNTVLKCIHDGKLSQSDMEAVDEIALHKINVDSDEWRFYKNLFFSDDGESNRTADGALTQNRASTWKSFLNYLGDSSNKDEENKKHWSDYPKDIYFKVLKDNFESSLETAQGWHYYFMNEVAHHAVEAIFWGLLVKMDAGYYTLDQLLDLAEHDARTLIQQTFPNLDKNIEEVIEESSKKPGDIIEPINAIGAHVRHRQSTEAIVVGMRLLIQCYRDNRAHEDAMVRFAQKYEVHNKRGNALQLFDGFVKRQAALHFADTLKNVMHSILNDHIAVAYTKMRGANKNLLKFIVEDGYLIHIETMRPTFTTPRLQTLYNFSRDMDFIDNAGRITPHGLAITNR